MSNKSMSGTCMVSLRKGNDYRFHPAQFSLSLVKSSEVKIKGALAPGRGSRAFVALFNPGSGLKDVLSGLGIIRSMLQNSKPGAVYGVGVKVGSKQEAVLVTANIEIQTAETFEVQSKEQLETASNDLPYTILFLSGAMRHWQDAYDDIGSLIRLIKNRGLPRGFLATKLGTLPILEKNGGLNAEIRPCSNSLDWLSRLERDEYDRIGGDEDEDDDDI